MSQNKDFHSLCVFLNLKARLCKWILRCTQYKKKYLSLREFAKRERANLWQSILFLGVLGDFGVGLFGKLNFVWSLGFWLARNGENFIIFVRFINNDEL